MIKNLTCIECPKGCSLTIEVKEGKVAHVRGSECEKGEKYAFAEIENPVRILTSSVLGEGLPLKMISVKTDEPIPRNRIFDAMSAVKKIRINDAVSAGDIIVENFLNLGINLIATRDVPEE
jgi:CxxC motif-containing protein